MRGLIGAILLVSLTLAKLGGDLSTTEVVEIKSLWGTETEGGAVPVFSKSCAAKRELDLPAAKYVLLLTGHMRTFKPDQNAWLWRNRFCGRKNMQVLGVLATRALDALPGDFAESPIRDSAVHIAGLKDFFCDPFYVDILTDDAIKKELPEELWPHMSASGRTETGPGRGENYRRMHLIAHLNMIYLRHAHATAMAQYKKEFGVEMPPNQLIVKCRPDGMLPPKLWSELPKIQALVDAAPNTFLSSDHPVYGLQDLAFVTTRFALEQLLSVDLGCSSQTEPAEQASFDRKPEQHFVCWLRSTGASVHFVDWLMPPLVQDTDKWARENFGESEDIKSGKEDRRCEPGGEPPSGEALPKPASLEYDRKKGAWLFATGALTCSSECVKKGGS
jgi:hypothetical protein